MDYRTDSLQKPSPHDTFPGRYLELNENVEGEIRRKFNNSKLMKPRLDSGSVIGGY